MAAGIVLLEGVVTTQPQRANASQQSPSQETDIVLGAKAARNFPEFAHTHLAHTSPHHDTAFAMLQSWANAVIPVALSRSTSNKMSTIISEELESRFVAEDYVAPFGCCPTTIFQSEFHSFSPMSRFTPGCQ